jgi:DNA-directed RNA polymerase subunit RPC12/RpoP
MWANNYKGIEMKGMYVCNKCKKETDFNIYLNPYSKGKLKNNHIEIVCKNCNYGFVIDIKKLSLVKFV